MKKAENSRNPYEYWQARQRGENPHAYIEQPECGFYRKKNGGYRKGIKQPTTYEPVAIFLDGDGKIVGRIGSKGNIHEVRIDDTANYDLRDIWPYISDKDISEETYRAVAERGEPWPDAHDPKKNPLEVEILSGSWAAIARKKLFDSVAEDEKTFPPIPLKEITSAASRMLAGHLPNGSEPELISNLVAAKAGISQYDKIDSDEMAARALSLKNEITSIAGELDKVRTELVRPHLDAQQEINGRLNPIIKDAKANSAKLLQVIGSWEDQKRESVNRNPASTNMPSPKAQIAPAVGRKASVKIVKVVVEIDLEKVWKQFGTSKEVHDLMMKLAQKTIDAGLPCEGAVIEERSIVR